MLAKKLQPGDTIGIVTPSNCVREEQMHELEGFIKKAEELGFKILQSAHLLDKDQYKVSIGAPEIVAEDFNSMIRNNDVKIVWFFQGGETANSILDLIDYQAIKKKHQIFIGKSDSDVLTLAINKKTDLVTFHGCDPKIGNGVEFDYEYTQKWFNKRFIEGSKEFEPAYEWKCMRQGQAEGKIIGCNMSSMLKLLGTKYFPDFKDSILFIEGYEPDIRKLISKLTQFKQLGVLSQIKGLVIGHIHKFNPRGIDITLEEVVVEQTKEYDWPILKIEEFGHYFPHAFLPIGAKVSVDATNKKIEILEDFLK